MAYGNATGQTPQKSEWRGHSSLKKINANIKEKKEKNPNRTVRLMFQDEAGFGRINKPKRCWAPRGIRPCVPCHHIREYRYAYGAVEPYTGESFFLVLPWANTICMNIFLEELSNKYPEDLIILATDQASWHTTKKLLIPDNIELFYLLPCTPEWIRLNRFGKKSENVVSKMNYFIRLRM